MPQSDFDREIEKLSGPEAKQQRLAREQAARKRAAGGRAPDLDPTPLDERELVADDGVTRYYRTTDVELGIRRNLEQTYEAWVRVGAPESGPMASELVRRLAESYLAAPQESEVEAEVVQFAEHLGLTDMLPPLAEEYNAAHRREEYSEIAADAFRGLSPEAIARAGELLEPELLDQVRRGTADPDELRVALSLRAEAANEVVVAETRRAELDQFDEELARHTPKFDEELQEQYRAELTASSDKQVQVDPERISARTERRLGLEDGLASEREAEFDEALAEHSPSAEFLEREAHFAKVVEGSPESQ